MRSIILVSLLLLLILVLTVCGVWYIQRSAAQVSQPLQQLAPALTEENWQQAGELFSLAQSRWQKTEKAWRMMIDHEDMRDIEISFVDLATALQQQDATECQRELAELLFFIAHVGETERVEIGNIF